MRFFIANPYLCTSLVACRLSLVTCRLSNNRAIVKSLNRKKYD